MQSGESQCFMSTLHLLCDAAVLRHKHWQRGDHLWTPQLHQLGWDWAWGLPLVSLTVVLHAYFLGLLNKRFRRSSAIDECSDISRPHQTT